MVRCRSRFRFRPAAAVAFPLGRCRNLVGLGGRQQSSDDRVNVAALRDMTDDSGGRTEIIREARDLDPATVGIADELSKQVPTWDTRRRERETAAGTRSASKSATTAYRVRARRGYVAN